MADNPYAKYAPAQSDGRVTAAPLPRNPDVVAEEQRDTSRKNREESYDRGDRTFDEAKKFRDEFRSLPSVANYNVALGTFNSAMKTQTTPEGDQSLITAFARMMDPNSVVRDSEFATAAGNERAFDRIEAQIKKELGYSGAGRLTETGRSRLREEMRNLVINRFKQPYELDRQQYAKFADMQGIDPYMVTGESAEMAFPPEFRAQLEEMPEGNNNLADAGATQGAVKLPPEYQQEHYAYLQQNWGKMDPQAYAEFRSGLDEKYGQTPNPQAYSGAVAGFNELANLGGTPDQLGLVPDAKEDVGIMNSVAQFEPGGVPVGAFATNMANAGSFGLAGALSGQQDKLESLREENPWGSGLGELAGGVTGTMGAGKLLGAITPSMNGGRAASILANPTTADAGFGAIYGATQDTENPFRGALVGTGSALVGNQIGKRIGQAMPGTFAGGAMRQADEAVPSIPQLKQQADGEYLASEQAGQIADPAATQDLFERASGILRGETRLTPANRLIGGDTPTKDAYNLISDFAGEEMLPTQAGSVRKVLGEGLMATKDGMPDKSQRRLSGMLLDDFDEWADPALPGISQARETASRYLQGEEIDAATEMAQKNASYYTGSGKENALRNAFRNMDKATLRGKRSFDDQVSGAINNVAAGNGLSNTARAIGKFAPTGVVPILGSLAMGGGAGAMTGGITGAAVTAGMMGAGLFGRRVATRQAERGAEVASLMARGGPEYQQLYRDVIELAGQRGGNFGGGLFGSSGSIGTRK